MEYPPPTYSEAVNNPQFTVTSCSASKILGTCQREELQTSDTLYSLREPAPTSYSESNLPNFHIASQELQTYEPTVNQSSRDISELDFPPPDYHDICAHVIMNHGTGTQSSPQRNSGAFRSSQTHQPFYAVQQGVLPPVGFRNDSLNSHDESEQTYHAVNPVRYNRQGYYQCLPSTRNSAVPSYVTYNSGESQPTASCSVEGYTTTPLAYVDQTTNMTDKSKNQCIPISCCLTIFFLLPLTLYILFISDRPGWSF